MFRRRKKAQDDGSGDASPDAPEATPAEAREAPADVAAAAEQAPTDADTSAEPVAADDGAPRKGLFGRLRQGLSKTRSSMAEGIGQLLLGDKEISDDVIDELETALLLADVGMEATREIIDGLTARVKRRELNNTDALFDALATELRALLEPVERPLEIDPGHAPHVVLMVGVNGVGKTTTIGKLAAKHRDAGLGVVLAAGDTFRAAAVEQLQTWGERTGTPVISQGQGADSASVVFDALQAARARGADLLIADTAGRLQNKAHLMDELAKVVRVMGKVGNNAPHDVLLVLDAGTGQNALRQVAEFRDAVGVTGLVLTKLDGTAKGGIVFAIARATGLPIHYIGVGEGVEDLRPFVAAEFVDALLARDDIAAG